MKNMSLGIFTPEVSAQSPAELFTKIRDYGFTKVQFDFASVDKEEMPERISDQLLAECKAQAEKNNIEISVINGTYNMAHPDKAVREDGAKRFLEICRAAKVLNCPVISLCTGTRTRESMWVPHPDNETKEAWQDMAACMELAIQAAEQFDLLLGLETEASNILNSPEKVRKLIHDMQSDRLRVIMDGANLFQVGTAHKSMVRDILKNGFDLLGEYVVVAHGKDIKEGDGIDFTYTGGGIVDFAFFLDELDKIHFKDGMIIHGTKSEVEIQKSVAFMRELESKR